LEYFYHFSDSLIMWSLLYILDMNNTTVFIYLAFFTILMVN